VGQRLISVVLPNFNHGRYLPQAISGVLGQTYGNLELHIRDDASTDESRHVIEEAARRDPRVKPVYGQDRRGNIGSVNELLAETKGELLYFASADDFIDSRTMFEEFSRFFDEHEAAGAVYGKMLELRADNNDEPLWLTGQAHREGLIAGLEFAEHFLLGNILPVSTSAIVRRDAFVKCGGLDPALGASCDLNLMAVMGVTFGVVYVDKPYACYRIQQTHFSRSEPFDSYIEHLAMMERNICRALSPTTIPNEWRKIFRERWIEYRLRARWQVEFLQGLSTQLATLDYWKLHYLPPAYGVLKASVQREIDSSANVLNNDVSRAREIFARIAGPVD
jgi:glycosyltransferase involved in cell wall biosynthesis